MGVLVVPALFASFDLFIVLNQGPHFFSAFVACHSRCTHTYTTIDAATATITFLNTMLYPGFCGHRKIVFNHASNDLTVFYNLVLGSVSQAKRDKMEQCI